jgi:dTDP-glucose pyrophosphorylase
MITEKLKRFIVSENDTIFTVMHKINDNYKEIALVLKGEKLTGVITDGDIRRGLLQGLDFNSPAHLIMSKNFISVYEEVDWATVLDIMKANSIFQLPITDKDKNLKGIHFFNELTGASEKNNIAVIMAGGKGVRLRPLTENCPKPMINVAGRPILERIILHLAAYGIRNIYIAINYLGEMIENYFKDGSIFGCSIQYLKENQPLGTGGALSLLPDVQKEPILVLNGDLIMQVNIQNLIRFHEQNEFEATIGVKHHQINIPFGVIQNKGINLTGLQEKPTFNYLINAGIYCLNPVVLTHIPKDTEYPITNIFEKLIQEKRKTGVFSVDEDWIDIGMHKELRRANGDFD